MADFSNLEPETRAFAMVGQFMHAFALMETELHNAIGTALTIEKTKTQILATNIEFSKKVQILRRLIHISDAFSTDEKKERKSKLQGMIRYAETRNMAAHCSFAVSEDGVSPALTGVVSQPQFPLRNGDPANREQEPQTLGTPQNSDWPSIHSHS